MGEPGITDSATDGPVPEGAPTEDRLLNLLRRVLRTYARDLWALLVVAGLPLAPVVLSTQVLAVWPAREGVFVNGLLESFTDPLALPLLLGTGFVTVMGLLSAPISLGASVLFGGGALLGRRISVRAAWRGALRRYRATLAWLMTLIALVSGALALALWLVGTDMPLLMIGLLLLPPLLFLSAPLAVALPVALLEGRGPVRALQRAWEMGWLRRRAHLLLVTASYGVTLFSGTVLEPSLLRWTELVEGDLVLATATTVVPILTAPLSLLLMCAPVAYSGVFQPSEGPSSGPAHNLDPALVGAHLPATRTIESGSVSPTRGMVTVPLLVAALFAPPLLGPATVAANPFELPDLTVGQGPTPRERLVVDIDPTPDGALVGTAHSDQQTASCDPDCTTVFDRRNLDRGSGVTVEEGAVYATQWREFTHGERGEEGFNDPHPNSGLYLLACEDALDCDGEADGVLVRPYADSQHHSSSAATPLAGGGVLVASYVKGYGHPSPFAEHDSGGLWLHVCEDTACADPRPLPTPPELWPDPLYSGGVLLDTAAAPNGGFAVAVSAPHYGSLTVLACEDVECEEPEVATVVGDQYPGELENNLESRLGARIEYRADGTPVLTRVDAHTGAAQVVDCHDAVCSESTVETVTGPGWARALPGLAVDSRDRPHLLTVDMTEQRLVLLSCADTGCANTTSIPLAAFDVPPQMTGLALDEHDRPHMVWSGSGAFRPSGADLGNTGVEGGGVYMSCTEPYCGSEPATP